ncbi:MAG TPA: glycosyl hydrolase, partial [Bryobacteraceae bacterium]|nr:glycosyl hydrolase [Bryobacteraceae bacterium]
QANWAPDLFAQFEKRRGYKLQSELPALFGDEQSIRAARVKSDYRETLSDLLVEDFTPTWANWSRKHGFITRNQAHGSPGSLLDLYAAVDVPETEMFNRDRSTIISKFASSAAHVAGRKLVASETGTWLAEHFNETLAGLKDLLDQLFTAGVNHVIYHGTIYSPDDAPWPGWLFYASTQMNPRSAIWRDAPSLNAYIERCQSLLQHGRPDNDILLYWPIYDVWHNPKGLNLNFTVHNRTWVEDQPAGRLAESLFNRGYSFDFISDRQLQTATAATGYTQVTGGKYRVVLAPATEHMPLSTLERLLELARSGATVVFQNRLPAGVPGLKDVEQRNAQMQMLLGSLSLGRISGEVSEAQFGKGRILVGDAEQCLAAASARRESLVDHSGLQYIRRASPSGSFYFISNRGTKPLDGWVPLSVSAVSAALLDPMSGRAGLAASRKAGKGIEVYLQLESGGSVFVRTSGSRIPGAPWQYWNPSGEAVPMQGVWNVRFVEGGPELPPSFSTARLSSWAEAGGESAQRFAGAAVYSIRFDAPSPSGVWTLELGDVRESARVRVNGHPIGTLIAPPFRIVLEGVKPRSNLLEIEVTNTSANRLRDLDLRKFPWKVFHDINIVNLDYKPLDPSKWPLRQSGLLGPVTLRPLARLEPK